ncbi:hypothetical protein Aduo_018845 [Ancylostoma duodenale]
MKVALDKLIFAVQDIAKQNAAQVKLSLKAIHDSTVALRNVPSMLEKQADASTRAQTRTSEELANLTRGYVASACGEMDKKLEDLQSVEEELNKLVTLTTQVLPSKINEVLTHAAKNDRCMRSLAQILEVAPTEVVHKVKTITKLASQQSSQLTQVPKQDHPRHPTTKTRDEAINYEQLNVDEFGDVEYHLDFDPIAAAQGESRRSHPRSASRRGDLESTPDEKIVNSDSSQ